MTQPTVRGALWANDLTRLPTPARRAGYVLLEVADDVLAAELAQAMNIAPEVAAERLETSRAFVARSRLGEVASWLWVSTGDAWAEPIARHLGFAVDECHGHTARTLERHQRRGLCADVLQAAGWQMARSGYRLMWNGVLDDNPASQQAHRNAGFAPVLHLVAADGHLLSWPADYADARLVERARTILAAGTLRAA